MVESSSMGSPQERSYREELVSTVTDDQFGLDGAVIRPVGRDTQPVPIVWIHGFADSFHGRHTLRVGRLLARRGYTFVSGDTRGHDMGALFGWSASGPRYGGSWWEELDQSPSDLDAWVRFTAELGFSRCVLAGHSLGAAKALYYQAQRQDSRVLGLVAASGGLGASRAEPERLALAERMVEEGRGHELLPWERWHGALVSTSARTLVSSVRAFGASAAGPLLAGIRCPILAFYGGEEASMGASAALDDLRRMATSAQVATHTIPGANHVYTDQEGAVAALIAGWIPSFGGLNGSSTKFAEGPNATRGPPVVILSGAKDPWRRRTRCPARGPSLRSG